MYVCWATTFGFWRCGPFLAFGHFEFGNARFFDQIDQFLSLRRSTDVLLSASGFSKRNRLVGKFAGRFRQVVRRVAVVARGEMAATPMSERLLRPMKRGTSCVMILNFAPSCGSLPQIEAFCPEWAVECPSRLVAGRCRATGARSFQK